MRELRSLKARAAFLRTLPELQKNNWPRERRREIAETRIEYARLSRLVLRFNILERLVIELQTLAEFSDAKSGLTTDLTSEVANRADDLEEELYQLHQTEDSAYAHLDGVAMLNQAMIDGHWDESRLAKSARVPANQIRAFTFGEPIEDIETARRIAGALRLRRAEFLKAFAIRVPKKKKSVNVAVEEEPTAIAWEPEPEMATPPSSVDDVYLAIGSHRLCDWVEQSNLSETDLLEIIDWKRERLHGVLEGQKWPILTELRQMARVLGKSESEILAAYGFPEGAFQDAELTTEAMILEMSRRRREQDLHQLPPN